MKATLITTRQANNESKVEELKFPLTGYGVPAYLPGQGDVITVKGIIYTISHLHWNFDTHEVRVYASRRDA